MEIRILFRDCSLAQKCVLKAKYWSSPTEWSDADVAISQIDVDKVIHEASALLLDVPISNQMRRTEATPPERLKTIAVVGSGTNAYEDLARPLGELLASAGFNLLTGGGQGTMLAVTKAFVNYAPRIGYALGVVPGKYVDGSYLPKDGYPNVWVEIPVLTHLPGGGDGTEETSRNHINILSADVVIALPGSQGTLSEVSLALRYNRPIIAFLGSECFEDLPAEVVKATSLQEVENFVSSAVD